LEERTYSALLVLIADNQGFFKTPVQGAQTIIHVANAISERYVWDYWTHRAPSQVMDWRMLIGYAEEQNKIRDGPVTSNKSSNGGNKYGLNYSDSRPDINLENFLSSDTQSRGQISD